MFKSISFTLFICFFSFNALSVRIAVYADGARARELAGENRVVVDVEGDEATVSEVKEALRQRLGVNSAKIKIFTPTQGNLTDTAIVNVLQQQYRFKVLP